MEKLLVVLGWRILSGLIKGHNLDDQEYKIHKGSLFMMRNIIDRHGELSLFLAISITIIWMNLHWWLVSSLLQRQTASCCLQVRNEFFRRNQFVLFMHMYILCIRVIYYGLFVSLHFRRKNGKFFFVVNSNICPHVVLSVTEILTHRLLILWCGAMPTDNFREKQVLIN